MRLLGLGQSLQVREWPCSRRALKVPGRFRLPQAAAGCSAKTLAKSRLAPPRTRWCPGAVGPTRWPAAGQGQRVFVSCKGRYPRSRCCSAQAQKDWRRSRSGSGTGRPQGRVRGTARPVPPGLLELFRRPATQVDDSSLFADSTDMAHPQAVIQLHTGSALASLTRPSIVRGSSTVQAQTRITRMLSRSAACFGGAVLGRLFSPRPSRTDDQRPGHLPSLKRATPPHR